MNWFDTSGLTSLAKTALKEAQKTIDKALDIQDESSDEQEDGSTARGKEKEAAGGSSTPQKDTSDFFSSWGLTVSAESCKDIPFKEQPVVTESPSKSSSQSVWGSFAGSFFEQPNADDATIVRPPKAKSMNVISDSKYDSQDDLFSKSQLVMSESEGLECKNSKDDKIDERRGSSRSNMLSLVSSRNSSDSVEVLSQSMKTTPDSEISAQSISQSSSVGQKNSESVEILPDSLLSPSSIECLGFDSYTSEKNSPSSNFFSSSSDASDKKSIGDCTEKVETADSVSLVADDDDDTMSYNSVSECTAPTVLDTDDKSVSPYGKPLRTESVRKTIDKEFIHLDQPIIPQRVISENSSNDGSWSDRTLNADNVSDTLDSTLEDQKKEIEQEDLLMEKLSDSSSFYNVNVSSTEMIQSDSMTFVNVDKQQCHSSESSHKDSVKERISPISSDGKSSDLVKIGSDRTSGHTSGDELETTTSSDIEIIPSPNGDNGHSFCRNSPAKYAFKQAKFDGTTSPNLVDLVLGKSLATKIRGHNRELSEASIQSNTSDESQGSENERLMRRLSEMSEILEARENRLMEVSRNNAELAETNSELKSQVENLLAKHEGGDINMITEDYTQRMSALEKKFQQAIREKDQLRKQLDALKTDSSSRKNSSEMENAMKEKDDIIAQLQEEGEKLARQQLQQSNIIKKLRAKEKDNEQVIKSLRDKIAEQSSELDRLKRSLAAKEEIEVSQIEAIYHLTTANKKMETELVETKSALDDTIQKLESTKTSLDITRRELNELQRSSVELQKRRSAQSQLQAEKQTAEAECEKLKGEVQRLRAELVQEEKRWVSREEALRRELSEARDLCASLEARGAEGAWGPGAEGSGGAGGVGAASLLAQLAALQRSALERDHSHASTTAALAAQLSEAESSMVKAIEKEKITREENQDLRDRLTAAEGLLRDVQGRLDQCVTQSNVLHEQLECKKRELSQLKCEKETEISSLLQRVSEIEKRLANVRDALETEKKRNAILQEQLSSRGDVSPPHSVISDTGSLWTSYPVDEGTITPTIPATAFCVEETLAHLTRKEGEVRALSHTITQLRAEKEALRGHVATLQAELDECRTVQEQYDALLQMYGEKEEQLEEVKLDLQDVTQLYKQQLDELIALKQRRQ